MKAFRKDIMLDEIRDYIKKVKHGDKEAYFNIVTYYQQSIYGYLFRMINNHQDAEDLTQETFTTAYYKINQLRNVDSFKSWLISIAYTQAQQYFRKKKLNFLLTEKLKYQQKNFVEDKDHYDIPDIIRNILTPYEISLLILRVVEEMSYEELSSCLNRKPVTLRKQYERIRKKLRSKLYDMKEVFTYEI